MRRSRLVVVTQLCSSAQLLEAETMRHVFMNNYHLCSEISERVVQHFVRCIETHGRHVEYLRFLQTIVKADGKYVKKCQDMVMTEVGSQRAPHQPHTAARRDEAKGPHQTVPGSHWLSL